MANPLSVNSANQFIGSKISLISKADIRYEGVLYSLDLREATISLAKVRSFGTEDRPTERPIPMKDEIYEFIIFRGADIKSIDVLEPPKNGSTLSCGLPQDPAIIEVSSHYRANGMGHGGHGACGMDHHHMRYNGRGGEGVFDGLLRGAGGRGVGRERGRRNNSGGRSGNGQFRGQGQGQGEGRRSRQDDGGYNGNGRRRSGSRRGQGQNSPKGILAGQGRGRSGDRAARTRGIIAPQQPPKVTFQDPFDFEKSNEEAKNAMEKLKMNGEAEGVEGSPVKDSEVKDNMGLNKEDMIYYDKDKFFDNISCEALERTKGRNSRPDWRAERKLNAETFGLTYNPQGQGQGGRGGRQGQGQGQGYNNNGGYRSYRYGGNGNYGQMRYNNSRNYGNRSYGRPQQMRN